MPNTHGILNLIMLAITIWCYWRILGKSGFSRWWSYLLLLSLVIVYFSGVFRSPIFIYAPYVMPTIMIWIFAYIRWPSYEEGHDPARSQAFAQQGRDRRDQMPFADSHRTENPRFTNASSLHGAKRRKTKKNS